MTKNIDEMLNNNRINTIKIKKSNICDLNPDSNSIARTNKNPEVKLENKSFIYKSIMENVPKNIIKIIPNTQTVPKEPEKFKLDLLELGKIAYHSRNGIGKNMSLNNKTVKRGVLDSTIDWQKKSYMTSIIE